MPAVALAVPAGQKYPVPHCREVPTAVPGGHAYPYGHVVLAAVGDEGVGQ